MKCIECKTLEAAIIVRPRSPFRTEQYQLCRQCADSDEICRKWVFQPSRGEQG